MGGRRRLGGITCIGGLVAGVLLVSLGAGYQTSRALLGDGGAFVQTIDGVAYVNAGTDRAEAQIALDLAGDAGGAGGGGGGGEIQVVQPPGGDVYVVDTANQTLTPIDPVSMDAEAPSKPAPEGEQGNLEVHAAAEDTYATYEESGTIQVLDPVTLDPQVTVDVTGPISMAVVDDAGRLWAADEGSGSIVRLTPDGERVARGVAQPGHALALTLVGGAPVVVDATAGLVFAIDPGTATPRDSIDVGSPLDSGVVIAAPGAPGPFVWMVVPASGRLLGVNLATRQLVVLTVDGAGDTFGPPVVAGGRVYVPDFNQHRVSLFDEATFDPLDPIDPGGTGRDLEVFARSGSVWIHDPTWRTGVRVGPDGVEHDFDKGTGQDIEPVPPEPSKPAPEPEPDPVNVVAAAPEPNPAPPPVLPPPPPTAAVPDLVGLSTADACAAIEALGLGCAPRADTASRPGTRRDEVVGQDPPAGTVVELQSTVVIDFYAVDPVTVPDVLGLAHTDACDRLANGANLICQEVVKPVGDPPGIVLTQDPAAGAIVPPGTPVRVTYYDQPATVEVPNLIDQNIDAACGSLPSGLTCGERVFADDPTNRASFMVWQQSVPAGTRVPVGTALTLTWTVQRVTLYQLRGWCRLECMQGHGNGPSWAATWFLTTDLTVRQQFKNEGRWEDDPLQGTLGTCYADQAPDTALLQGWDYNMSHGTGLRQYRFLYQAPISDPPPDGTQWSGAGPVCWVRTGPPASGNGYQVSVMQAPNEPGPEHWRWGPNWVSDGKGRVHVIDPNARNEYTQRGFETRDFSFWTLTVPA